MQRLMMCMASSEGCAPMCRSNSVQRTGGKGSIRGSMTANSISFLDDVQKGNLNACEGFLKTPHATLFTCTLHHTHKRPPLIHALFTSYPLRLCGKINITRSSNRARSVYPRTSTAYLFCVCAPLLPLLLPVLFHFTMSHSGSHSSTTQAEVPEETALPMDAANSVKPPSVSSLACLSFPPSEEPKGPSPSIAMERQTATTPPVVANSPPFAELSGTDVRKQGCHAQGVAGAHHSAETRRSYDNVSAADDESRDQGSDSPFHNGEEMQGTDSGAPWAWSMNSDGVAAAPRESPLPWWKRILVDAAYRAEVTSLATACYRQEFHVLEEHPFLLTSAGPALAAASNTARASPTASTLPWAAAGNTSAQFVCVPSTRQDEVKLWDTLSGTWAEACLGTIRDQQQPWLAATAPATAPTSPAPPLTGKSAAAQHRDEAPEKDESFFSRQHPKTVIRQSALTSKHRRHPDRDPFTANGEDRDASQVYCSSEALRRLRPDSPRTERQRMLDAFDQLYGGNSLDNARRLCRVLDTPAYRAYYGEGYFTELLEAQRQSVRQQHAAPHPHRQRRRPPSSLPQGAMGKAGAGNVLPPVAPGSMDPSTGRVHHGEPHGWASAPRTSAEIEVDNVLGLSYLWRGVLPPAGFIRLAPDPRRAMWSEDFAQQEANRRRRCPALHKKPTDTELLEEPTGFNHVIAERFNTPLCIHMFRKRRQQTVQKETKRAAAGLGRAGTMTNTVPQVTKSGRRAGNAPTPQGKGERTAKDTATSALEKEYEYLGTYRQSLLLVHVKVYFRALHEQQRRCKAGPLANLGGCTPAPLAATSATALAEGALAGTRTLQKGEQTTSRSEFNRTLRASPFTGEEAEEEDGNSSDTPTTTTVRQRMKAPTRPLVYPELLRGVPEVPFPVLRVATAATEHVPVPATSVFAVNKAAALIKASAEAAQIHAQTSGRDIKPKAAVLRLGVNDRKVNRLLHSNDQGRSHALQNKTNTLWSLFPGVGTLSTESNAPHAPPGTRAQPNTTAKPMENSVVPSEGMWMGLHATPSAQPPTVAFSAARVWRQLHYHSRSARDALKAIFVCLPRDAEGCLGKEAYTHFVLGLLNMFFPTHLATRSAGGKATGDETVSSAPRSNVHGDIAEEEWVYRGTTENVAFATFFEKFFSFPFIFLRDLPNVTERDYVEFWALVQLALFKAPHDMAATLNTRVLAQLKQRARDTVAAKRSFCEADRTQEEALLSLIRQAREGQEPSQAGANDDADDETQVDHHEKHPGGRTPAAGAVTLRHHTTRGQSVLYEMRLSHDVPPSAAAPPLSDFTTAQLYTLYMTDYSAAPTPHTHDNRLVMMPRTPGLLRTRGEARQATEEEEEKNNPKASLLLATGRTRGASSPHSGDGSGETFHGTLTLDSAAVDGLDDHHRMLGEDQQGTLADLLKQSTHYKRRHEKFKAECLNKIAIHQGVTSTWELHKDAVFGAETDFVEGVTDVAVDTEAPYTAAPVSGLSLPSSAHPSLPPSPTAPVSSLQTRSTRGSGEETVPFPPCHAQQPFILPASAAAAHSARENRLPSLFPSTAATRTTRKSATPANSSHVNARRRTPSLGATHSSSSVVAAPTTTTTTTTNVRERHTSSSLHSLPEVKSATTVSDRDADEEMDRLIRFLADIPDEVFTEGQVSVRERFQTYEAFQRARGGRL